MVEQDDYLLKEALGSEPKPLTPEQETYLFVKDQEYKEFSQFVEDAKVHGMWRAEWMRAERQQFPEYYERK